VSAKAKSLTGRRLAVVVSFALCLFRAEVARAQSAAGPAAPLSWPYPKFRPAEYVATGVLGVAAAGVFLLAKGPAVPRWTGGILFDNAVRDAVRLRTPGGRDASRTAGDVTAFTTVLVAVGIDSLLVPLVRRSSDVAVQALLVDAEAFAVNAFVTTSAYTFIGRARPSYEDCQRNPSFDPLCNSGATSSFWSGHTALSFTAAGLSCAHHAYLHVYGDPTADALGCAGMVTLASATATFRVLGDRHYATDVLTGAAVGFGIGYGVPALLHYAVPPGEGDLTVAPSSAGLGLALSGRF
jgi:membrane-associated phospholipid phosphatase